MYNDGEWTYLSYLITQSVIHIIMIWILECGNYNIDYSDFALLIDRIKIIIVKYDSECYFLVTWRMWYQKKCWTTIILHLRIIGIEFWHLLQRYHVISCRHMALNGKESLKYLDKINTCTNIMWGSNNQLADEWMNERTIDHKSGRMNGQTCPWQPGVCNLALSKQSPSRLLMLQPRRPCKHSSLTLPFIYLLCTLDLRYMYGILSILFHHLENAREQNAQGTIRWDLYEWNHRTYNRPCVCNRRCISKNLERDTYTYGVMYFNTAEL